MIFHRLYRLPSGEIVPVDDTTAKGAWFIDFTQVDGTIVQAVRADRPFSPGYFTYGDVTPEQIERLCANPEFMILLKQDYQLALERMGAMENTLMAINAVLGELRQTLQLQQTQLGSLRNDG